MNKFELLDWLQSEYQQWVAFLDQIDPALKEQPGVSGDWSMKDIVAHLTGWNHRFVARLQAAQRGEPEPLPPWPAHLQDEDEINAWIYESNRKRSLHEVLDASQQLFQQLFAVIDELPEDVQIDQVHEGGKAFNLVWVNNERFLAGEFFDHYYDDHEPDVRAWLARVERQ
jgi:hypothetical protein